ncbi:Cytidine deaminase [Kluyvera cryocrescens]|uniref:Cytidine deaminase n=1 Tax=Kluyvera cryocrescens TaxID=580 RepID=A0A485BZL7_KLUCR|nr:Cytidine deaminase [Kluyvera cryocrescens]
MHPRFQSAFTQLAADLQTAIAPAASRSAFPCRAKRRAGLIAGKKRRGWTKTRSLLRFYRWPPPAPARICPSLTSAQLRVASAAPGTSAAIWNFSAQPCSKPFMLNRAPLATPGCAVKKRCRRSPSTTPHAATAVSFMNELNSGLSLRINLPGRQPHTLQDYLPDAFGPKRSGYQNAADG